MQTSARRSQGTHDGRSKLPASLELAREPWHLILDPTIFGCLRQLLSAETLAQTYREFLKQTRERLQDFPSSLDSEAIHNLGHTIRGTAGMLGANQVAICAAELECEPTSSKALAQAIEHIREGCETLENALRKEQVKL